MLQKKDIERQKAERLARGESISDLEEMLENIDPGAAIEAEDGEIREKVILKYKNVVRYFYGVEMVRCD